MILPTHPHSFGLALDELEQCLNRLRWLYLRAIDLSPDLRDTPARAISFEFNDAFLSLAGLPPSTKESTKPTPLDWHWRSRGFSSAAASDLDWISARRQLGSALANFMDPLESRSMRYAELIALKPGFHEAWHHEAFSDDVYEGPDTPRGRVFAMLRGSSLPFLEVKGPSLSSELGADAFIGYAPCVFTEGPFVRRIGPEVSYYGELMLAGIIPDQQGRHAHLSKSFQVLDYGVFLNTENSIEGLAWVLKGVEIFAFNLDRS